VCNTEVSLGLDEHVLWAYQGHLEVVVVGNVVLLDELEKCRSVDAA